MDTKSIGQSLLDLLNEEVKSVGKELKDGGKGLAAYIDERAAVIAGALGTPGYRDALIAERDNVVLKAAGWTIDEADAFDQRFIGIVQSVLHVAIMAV